MDELMNRVSALYRNQLKYPLFWLGLVLLIALTAAWQTRNFSFDASSDTLVVQGDPALQLYQEMSAAFGGDDFIVLAWRPKASTQFSSESLEQLASLQSEIENVAGVAAVLTVLDVPLIKSPPMPLEDLPTGYRTLRDADVDLTLAREELINSPLFRDYLVSPDGSASVIKIDLQQNKELIRLEAARHAGENVDTEYRAAREAYVDQRNQLIQDVRTIRESYTDFADIYISGVPMIAADMIDYVKSDLVIFGSLVLFVIITLLTFFFRRLRWVLLPIFISGLSILMTTGLLGLAGKPVTVISSNFISLLAILCISFSIHLIVRYRELLQVDPNMPLELLVFETMASKFAPCLYTALTTILAFGSMLASRILPVEDFGWMMCLGITIAFVVTYIVFPSTLMLLGKGKPSVTLGQDVNLTIFLSKLAREHPGGIVVLSGFIAAIAVYGLTLVSYDNRFVDYFDEDTDIHQGMAFIDQNLGGTVPFDVYVQMGKYEPIEDEDDFFSEGEEWPERYWFTENRVSDAAEIQKVIASHRATGKVISIATMEQQARDFNDGEPLSSIEIAYVLGQLPDGIRDQIITPYADPLSGLVRINARTRESGGYFSRDELIESVRDHVSQHPTLSNEDVVITGMMVLFNDMLTRLADSQLQTLFYVVGATLLMFTILLRSFALAMIALVPNLIAAASVTAVMGYTGIPLDMMTITIAAISIGIGVDDAIHYLHRFRIELIATGDVSHAVENAHQSIGRAMYFTSTVIIVGFSILVFSNFLPTVYFGLLTALAMAMALIANLALLPALLVISYRGFVAKI